MTNICHIFWKPSSRNNDIHVYNSVNKVDWYASQYYIKSLLLIKHTNHTCIQMEYDILEWWKLSILIMDLAKKNKLINKQF